MHNKMLYWILLSIALGILGGIFFPEQILSVRWMGTLFINLLKLIALPLIFSSLISAITSIGNTQRLGSIGTYTIIYVLVNVSFAVVIGLILLNTFKPGVGLPPDLILANAGAGGGPAPTKALDFSSFLLSLFPPNIIAAAANFEIMPIVFFSIVFSIACISIGETAKPVVQLFNGLRDIFIKMIIWLMYLTPIGLFSLLGSAIAEASLQKKLLTSVGGMLFFILIFLIGLALQWLLQLAVVVFMLRRKPKEFIQHAASPMLTAFVTSSSIATLPVTLISAKQQHISDEVARFVLPFSTTINLAGTAMYEAVSALFFCQILGIHLSILAQLGVFLTSIVAGMGATGIPEGGLVTMVMVLRSVNVPTSALVLLLPFDRILDRLRTMVNVWGCLVCAATVDHFTAKKRNNELKELNAIASRS